MRESASTDLREPQGSNPLGPPGPELLEVRLRGLQSIMARHGTTSWQSLSSPRLVCSRYTCSVDAAEVTFVFALGVRL